MVDFDFCTIAGGTTDDAPRDPFCTVSVSELCGLNEETLLLLGFGGRAGRGLLSTDCWPVLLTGMLLMPFVCELLGATICTILGTIFGIMVDEEVAELVVVTVVGATLLIGFLGGTAIVPICEGDLSFSEDVFKDNLVGFWMPDLMPLCGCRICLTVSLLFSLSHSGALWPAVAVLVEDAGEGVG